MFGDPEWNGIDLHYIPEMLFLYGLGLGAGLCKVPSSYVLVVYFLTILVTVMIVKRLNDLPLIMSLAFPLLFGRLTISAKESRARYSAIKLQL